MTVALFPTDSNPPTFGTILALKYIEHAYEKIFVVVRDKPVLLSTDQVMNMLNKVLCNDGMKYSIISSQCDFEHDTISHHKFPKFDELITENPNIYSNLLSKGYVKLRLIPKPLGYDDMFHRTAYKRSITLEKIFSEMNTTQTPEKYINKK